MILNEKFEFSKMDDELFNISDYRTPSIEQALKEYKPRMIMGKNRFCLVAGKSYLKENLPQSLIYADGSKYYYSTDYSAIRDLISEGSISIDLDNFVSEALKHIEEPKNKDDYVICVSKTQPWYGKGEYYHAVLVEYVNIENLDEDADWDNFKEGNAISGYSHVYFDLEKALKYVLKMYNVNIRKLNNYWDLAINDLKKYWESKNGLKDRIRSKRPHAPKATEPTDEEWWDSLTPEEKTAMLKKMRATGLGESRHLRGRMLKEDFCEDEYERLRNTLENKLGVTFYSDPGSRDDIAEFVDTYGGSADVCFGEDKNDRFLIELGYTCSKDGELNIWYSVMGPEDWRQTEPDEQGLTNWNEVADKIINKVNSLTESRISLAI